MDTKPKKMLRLFQLNYLNVFNNIAILEMSYNDTVAE